MFEKLRRAGKGYAALASVLTVVATDGHCGSVAGNGGATEVTQIANNIQLADITALNTEQLAEEIQQTATQMSQLTTQVNQYTTMIQNLRTLPMQAFNQLLGGLPGEGKALLQLGRASWNLFDSANRASNVLKAAEYSMGTMGINPAEYYGYMVNAARYGNAYWGEAVRRDTAALQDYQTKIAEWQQASENAQGATGNLQAQQATAAAVTKAGAEISRLNAQISQANADANAFRGGQAGANVRSIEALQALEAAKARALEDDQKWRMR